MVNATTYRVQRALTGAELTAITTAIGAAGSASEILTAVLRTVFGTLLAPLGESLDDYGPGRQLDPGQFAIPQPQWEAISHACIARAGAFGRQAHMAIELINVMPCAYDDPDAVVPSAPAADQRPYEHVLTVTREAADVIAACARRCADLGGYFGEDSAEYREAARSWLGNLSHVFSMAFGARTRVTRDADLSLLVTCDSGFVYGIIFHPVRRRCTQPGCKAVINDDGSTWTYMPDDPACPDGQHIPCYPLDAPAPGSWSFHS
jgi:hypothetical protein